MRNDVYIYAFYRNSVHDGSLYDCLPDSMARVPPVDDKALFVFVVMPLLITLSGRSLSLLLMTWA